MLQRGEASLDYFIESVDQLERKVDAGHPSIAVKTVYGNRIKELANTLYEMMTQSKSNNDLKMNLIIRATREVYRSKALFKRLEIDMSDVVPVFEKAIKRGLVESDVLLFANRTPMLRDFLSSELFQDIDLDKLRSINFSLQFMDWKEEFNRIEEELAFNGKILRNVDFIELSLFDRLLKNYFGVIREIEKIINDLNFSYYIQNIDTIEYDPKSFLLVDIYRMYGEMLFTITLIADNFSPSDFAKSLQGWKLDPENRYCLLEDCTTKFKQFHEKVQEQMAGLSSHANLQAVIHGEHPLIKQYLTLVKYVKFFISTVRTLEKILGERQGAEERRELEGIAQQIESMMTRSSFRSGGNEEDVFDKELKLLMVRVLMLCNLALSLYYESSPKRIEETSKSLWKLFENHHVDSLTFDVLMLRPILYATLGTQMQKQEYLATSREHLKAIEQQMDKAPPYMRFSFIFFSSMLDLITEKEEFNVIIGKLRRVMIEESMYILSQPLVNEIETYLEYLERYHTAVEENTIKPALPMEIEHRNLSLGAGSFFRHYKSLDAYWLNNIYIELKVPIFGSTSDSIYTEF